jgi:hypothetical protein
MHLNKIYYFIVFLLFLISCKPSYTKNPLILKAESLLFSSPDSAYRILTSIKNPENLSKADYAAWCLHYTHAQYKLYYDIKSDSLIKQAVEYYEQSNLMEYSGLAYYLSGCIYDLNNNSKQSLYSYKKANDKLEKTQDLNTKGLVLYRVGNLYLKDDYLKESEIYIDEAIQVFKKSLNFKYLSYSYRTKAEIVYRQGLPVASIISTIDSCNYYATKTNDKNLINDIHAFKGKVLLQTNPLEAKINLLKAFNGLPFDRKSSASLLAYAYSKLNMPDSARFYTNYNTNNQLDNNSKFLQNVANAYVSKCEGKPDSAFLFFEDAYNLREKIYKQNIKEQLIRIDKQYDLSKKEAERAKLEIENREKIIVISILSVLILVGLLIHLQVRNRNKLKQKHLLLEQQTLKHELENKKHENSQNIALLQANILNKIENTLKFKRLQIGLINKGKLDEFQNEITQQSIISESDLNLYMHEADKLFNNNISKLKTEFPQLTNIDLIVISLICLGMDLNNCCILLAISLNTLYARRKRIKAHLCIDKNVNLDQWLVSKIVNNAQN